MPGRLWGRLAVLLLLSQAILALGFVNDLSAQDSDDQDVNLNHWAYASAFGTGIYLWGDEIKTYVIRVQPKYTKRFLLKKYEDKRELFIEIIVPVFPEDLKWIHKGDEVNVTGNNGSVQTAIVSRISEFVEEATQSVNVYLTYFASKPNKLLEGEYVDVVFQGAKVSGFEIPREALLNGSSVYELVDDKLVQLDVTIERQLNDAVVISGIDAEKTIVIESLTDINPTLKYMAR